MKSDEVLQAFVLLRVKSELPTSKGMLKKGHPRGYSGGRWMKKSAMLAASIVATISTSALAQAPVPAAKEHDHHEMIVDLSSLKWIDMEGFEKGAMATPIVGDIKKPGELYVIRTKAGPYYKLMPHTHPFKFQVFTVIEGSVAMRAGTKFEQDDKYLVGPGSVLIHPGDIPHYLWTGPQGVVLQITGIGPGIGIDYINPADDPRKRVSEK
jgi:quercetin dioxygenase-like cupin family protein